MKTLLRRLSHYPQGAVGLLVLLLVTVAALLAPLLAPHDPVNQDLLARLRAPGQPDYKGVVYALGSDALGRDVLSRIIYGSRVSLAVALIAVAVAGSIGTTVGMVAGYVGGWVGSALMRLVDIILSIPFLLLAIATVAILGPSFRNLILVLGLARWPRYARVAYSQTLSVREREFTQAARAVGARNSRIIGRHILPNIAAPMIVVATIEMGLMIIFEAGLSFLGLGVQPPTPSWGGMLAEGRNYLATAWWLATFPGLAIMLTVLGANLVGDFARDMLDPYTRKGIGGGKLA